MAAVTFSTALEGHLRKELQEQINSEGRSIAQGAMPSYEQYKYHCGIIKGLQNALDQLTASVEAIQKAGRGET